MKTKTRAPINSRIVISVLGIFLIGALAGTSASAQPFVTGLNGAAGSTVGPGGDLYVAEGFAGAITRIDPRSGEMTPLIDVLPPRVFPGFGGPVDVAFIGNTAYVLVTMVGSPFGADVDGIYRVDGPDSYTIIADIGAYAVSNPPPTLFDLPNGVQYSIEAYRGGLLVTDGHHNRVLQVKLNGMINDFHQFENVVPTGLDILGDEVLVALAGPAPHAAADGKIVAINSRSGAVSTVATGAALNVDVERGRGRKLFALSQGIWDQQFPGSPAQPNGGALLEVYGNGTFIVIANQLDRPTSVEVIQNTAYVVTLAGEILKIGAASGPPFGP
jgi:hypothetical protein